MKKLFVATALIAVIAASVFAFAACNNDTASTDAVEGWSANCTFLGDTSTATINFVSDKHWRVDVGGFAEESSVNTNYCRGEYYFDGEVGKSDLHMMMLAGEKWLFDEFGEDEQNNGNDPAYDPANVKLLDRERNTVANGEWVVYSPDDNGVYKVEVFLEGALGFMAGLLGEEEAIMSFSFYPPQDGTLGSNGDMSPVPPSEGPNMMAVIIAVPIAVVVVIVAVVVTVVLVKKNKKKKAAQSAAGEESTETSAPDETSSDGDSAEE